MRQIGVSKGTVGFHVKAVTVLEQFTLDNLLVKSKDGTHKQSGICALLLNSLP